MKREERKVLNEMKKLNTSGLINVCVPVNFSHEALQAIHEQLTIIKGLIAVKVCWNDIRNEYCILYIPAVSPEERQRQESENVDDIVSRLPKSDYTWNGYKKPEEEKPEEEKPEEEKPEEEKPEEEKTAVFMDIESGETVTIEQLKAEYDRFKESDPETFDYSFSEYVETCLTRNNGTLEEIRK